jgi:ATP-dependent exoDNAse (exonuclease V) alpha subunit
VGPGRPFAAALAAGLLPCIDLRQIYRSAAGSAIVKAAHAINQGEHAAHATARGCDMPKQQQQQHWQLTHNAPESLVASNNEPSTAGCLHCFRPLPA